MPTHMLFPAALGDEQGWSRGGSGSGTLLNAISNTGLAQWIDSDPETDHELAFYWPAWEVPDGGTIFGVRWCAMVMPLGGPSYPGPTARINVFRPASTAYGSNVIHRSFSGWEDNPITLRSSSRPTDPSGNDWDANLTSLNRIQHTAQRFIGEAYATSGAWRIYAIWLEIEWAASPTVEITGPTTTVTDTVTPEVTWGYDHPNSYPQGAYRVAIGPSDSPAVTTYDSGWIESTDQAHRVAALAEGQHWVSVGVRTVLPGGKTQIRYDVDTITIDVERPNPPTLAATAHDDEARTHIEISGLAATVGPNLVPPDVWGWFQQGLGGQVLANRLWNLRGNGDEYWRHHTVDGWPDTTDQEYLISVDVEAHRLSPTVPGNLLSFRAGVWGPNLGFGQDWELQPGRQTVTHRFVPPNTYNTVALGVPVMFNQGQSWTIHDVQVRTFENNRIDWVEIQYLDLDDEDQTPPDALWRTLRQDVTVVDDDIEFWDAEAPLHRTRRYRVRGFMDHGDGLVVASEWAYADAKLESIGRWITGPLDVEEMPLQIQINGHTRTIQGREQVHYPAGLDIAVVESEPPTLQQTLSIWALDPAEHQRLYDLLRWTGTLLYRDWRSSTYFRWVGDRSAAQIGLDPQETDVMAGTMVEVAQPPAPEVTG